MSTVTRVSLGVVIVIVFVAVGALFYLSTNLNSLIVDAVETFGPKVTQSRVVLGSANVTFSGEGELSNLVIGNPQGYKADNAFTLGNIKVVLDVGSLTSDLIVIKSIDIIAPQITYEFSESASSNLQQLLNNVQQHAAQGGDSEEKTASSDGSEKKLIIDRLSIKDGVINIMTPLSAGSLRTLLPAITIYDIGREEGGSVISDVLALVMKKVTAAATQASGISIDGLKMKLRDKAAQVQDKMKGEVSEILRGKQDEVKNKLRSLLR